MPAGTTKSLLASVPARAKSVLEKLAKYSVMESGVRLVKRSPTFPTRNLESLWVEAWYSSSGVLPSAFAITFVLPKKSVYQLAQISNALYENFLAIRKLRSHIFQIGISHVLNREDKAVLVSVETFSDVGEELDC